MRNDKCDNFLSLHKISFVMKLDKNDMTKNIKFRNQEKKQNELL